MVDLLIDIYISNETICGTCAKFKHPPLSMLTCKGPSYVVVVPKASSHDQQVRAQQHYCSCHPLMWSFQRHNTYSRPLQPTIEQLRLRPWWLWLYVQAHWDYSCCDFTHCGCTVFGCNCCSYRYHGFSYHFYCCDYIMHTRLRLWLLILQPKLLYSLRVNWLRPQFVVTKQRLRHFHSACNSVKAAVTTMA